MSHLPSIYEVGGVSREKNIDNAKIPNLKYTISTYSFLPRILCALVQYMMVWHVTLNPHKHRAKHISSPDAHLRAPFISKRLSHEFLARACYGFCTRLYTTRNKSCYRLYAFFFWLHTNFLRNHKSWGVIVVCGHVICAGVSQIVRPTGSVRRDCVCPIYHPLLYEMCQHMVHPTPHMMRVVYVVPLGQRTRVIRNAHTHIQNTLRLLSPQRRRRRRRAFAMNGMCVMAVGCGHWDIIIYLNSHERCWDTCGLYTEWRGRFECDWWSYSNRFESAQTRVSDAVFIYIWDWPIIKGNGRTKKGGYCFEHTHTSRTPDIQTLHKSH